jgi:hypothetical protein
MSDYSIGGGGNKRSRFGAGLYPPTSVAKRWRWWNYLAALILVFAAVEAFVLLIGSSLLYTMPDQIQIGKPSFFLKIAILSSNAEMRLLSLPPPAGLGFRGTPTCLWIRQLLLHPQAKAYRHSNP